MSDHSPATPPGRPRRAVRRALVAVLMAATLVAMGVAGSGAATSTTVVSVTVPSATNLTATTCASGAAGSTSLGVVQPGSSVASTADCTVTFGSSNDTAMLRMFQSDRSGAAMWSWTRGAVDTSWGAGGRRTLAPGATVDNAEDAVVLSTGRIVVGGWYDTGGSVERGVLAAYTSGGAPDAGFAGGTVAVNVGTENDLRALAVQPDDKVLSAGFAYQVAGGFQFYVARHDANGVLDPTFGSGGIAMIDAFDCAADDILLLDDGRIVVAGHDVNTWDVCMARLTSTGALDTAFASPTGYLRNAAVGDAAFNVAVDSTGAYIVGGVASNDVFVARYTSAGVLDNTWGASAGRTVLNLTNGIDTAQGLVVTPTNQVILAATTRDAGWTAYSGVAIGFTSGGLVDTGFGTSGYFYTPNFTFVRDIIRQHDGQLLLAGDTDLTADKDVLLARLSASGSLDATFGTNGYATATIATTGAMKDSAAALLPMADGEVLAVGTAEAATVDWGMVQFASGGDVANYATGTIDWSAGTDGMFGACLRSIGGGAATDGSTWAADTVDADCADGNGDPWKPIVATGATAGAKVATAGAANNQSAVVNLRFGFRTETTQEPGNYVSPITFEVLAPAV